MKLDAALWASEDDCRILSVAKGSISVQTPVSVNLVCRTLSFASRYVFGGGLGHWPKVSGAADARVVASLPLLFLNHRDSMRSPCVESLARTYWRSLSAVSTMFLMFRIMVSACPSVSVSVYRAFSCCCCFNGYRKRSLH